VGRVDVVRLLVEPEEVHSRNEDGLCGVEEAARQSGFDRVFERVHEIIRFSSPLFIVLIPLYLIFYNINMHIHSSSSFFFALLFSLNFALNFVLNFEALSLFSSIDASGEVFFQSFSLSLSLLLLLPLLLLLLLLLDGIVE